MSKRRRTSSVASRNNDGDESDSAAETPHVPAPPSGRKRKRPDPVISASEICQQLYDTIRAFKKDDGSLLCDSFIRAPKRRQEPQYYEVVTQPIDLLRVQQKLKTDTYEDIEELANDIELLVKNAKAFYKPYTTEYKDAVSLWNLFHQTRQALEHGDDQRSSRMSKFVSSNRKSASVDNIEGDLSETSTINDDDNVYEEFFSTVMAAQMDGRPLHRNFQLLPSKKRYPEYYEVIDYPIDLKSIAMKIQSGEYSSLADMEKDLLTMTRNACHFNEPGSQIYKDSKTLKKIIQTKKQELEAHGRAAPAKTSERIRKRARGAPAHQLTSANVAMLEYDDDDEGDEDDMPEKEEEEEEEIKKTESDHEAEDKNSPHWKLFETVKNYLGPNGAPMAEHFWKLPSRRVYPNYYREIKNPVSLEQIRRKIMRGDYGTVSEVAGDLNIMFENAKRYNTHTSRLYKNAVRLQRLMQQRVQELLEIVQESSSDDESLSSVKCHVPRPRGRPRLNPLPIQQTPPSQGVIKVYSNPNKPTVLPLKKKLHSLQRHLLDFTCSDGRQPMLLFMEKPSKKLYPDYYNVIEKPIDMLTIEANIKNERYNTLDEIISDFKLMFSNCRQYNEEGSMIYEDANMLEKALNEKIRELMDPTERLKTPMKTIKIKAKQLSPVEQKLRTLYDAIRDYRDAKNRQLALIFMKLPNKLEYPDYYELIKVPIDMERIAQKLKSGGYESVVQLASDFILMFDNACKYNEPDSQIYKDALVLQRVCLQTKQLLREGEESVPDVALAVQEILMSLFTTVYNHQDEEGRCYSDSLAELPEHDEVEGGGRVRAISMDLIKRRLDKGLYKRLDHFQEDMFAIWDRARRLTRSDSQVFEDSVEMQSCFIFTRNQLCGKGNILQSPALEYSKERMLVDLDGIKQSKALQENAEEDSETRSSSDDSMLATGGNILPQTQYNKGDFVYVSAKKAQTEPAILQVERIWTNTDDIPMVYGNCYFRPFETFHVTTRKFLENEVFKTDSHTAVPLAQVTGKCFVMNVKEYFKLRPEGFSDKDIYVCESRYSTKSRSFKKIKLWPETCGDGNQIAPTLLPRDSPLEPKRVMSVFRERIEKHKDELAELDILENMQERERPDVVLGTEADVTYYCQYNTVCSGLIKTGDYVYVVTEGGRQMIAQVDTIWETKDNKCYFRGPFLIFPSEVASVVNKAFYKQEVLLTTVQDSSPLVGIVGKCAVLHYDDYLRCRPTEILETDVYVCESLYDDPTRTARKLKTGLKKYDHPKGVTIDEVYTFPRPLGPPPLASCHEIAQQNVHQGNFRSSNITMGIDNMDSKPQFTNLLNTALNNQDIDMLLENSMDETSMSSPAITMSLSSTPSVHPGHSVAQHTPVSTKKKKSDGEKKKVVTGYILYSSEVRKAITASNPEATFGEISRLVGNEWRSLPAAAKISWEERAAKCNEETASRIAEAMAPSEPVILEFVYECLWDECDWQFEDLSDLTEHCIGHIQQYCVGTGGFACMWRGCHRKRRGQPPFPNAPRLSRHVRDLHINKGNGRSINTNDKAKNWKPSSKPKQNMPAQLLRPGQTVSNVLSPIGGQISPHARNTPSPSSLSGGAVGGMMAGSNQPSSTTLSGKPALEPLFVAAPPRPQRVQHSEAYIRYIEGLHSEQKYISPWEKTLVQPPLNPDPSHYNPNKLPVHWLCEDVINGYGLQHDKNPGEQVADQGAKVLKALWALRDFMHRDAMCLHKNV